MTTLPIVQCNVAVESENPALPISLSCGHEAEIMPWKKDVHYYLPAPGGH